MSVMLYFLALLDEPLVLALDVSLSLSPQAARPNAPTTATKAMDIDLDLFPIMVLSSCWCCEDSAPRESAPTKLIEVDRADQHGADGDLLPERLDPRDHEPVLQDRRDEDAEDRPDHPADTAEQAGAADDHRSDGVQVVGVVTADGGRAEARQRQVAGQARQGSGQPVHLDQGPRARDARAPRGLLVRADGVRVAAEPRESEDHAAHHRHGHRD